jgi:long-chain fatty acid transport protein
VRYLGGQKIDVTNGTVTATQIPAVKADGSKYVLPITLGPTLPAGTPMDALVASQFASGGKLSSQTATTMMPMPAQVVIGAAVQATPKVKLLLDYQYTNWKSFDVLAIDGQYLKSTVIENYGNTSGVRFGAEFALGAKSVVRAGIDLHGAAAPDETVTPNLPEGSRREFSIGFGSQLSKRARFDIGYLYLSQPERAGRTGAMPNNGVFDFGANLFGASLTIGF